MEGLRWDINDVRLAVLAVFSFGKPPTTNHNYIRAIIFSK